MKSVKVIFIAMEVAMLLGVILFVFLTDWTEVEKQGALTFKIMIVLLSIGAVVFQKEQQEIEWDEEEE